MLGCAAVRGLPDARRKLLAVFPLMDGLPAEIWLALLPHVFDAALDEMIAMVAARSDASEIARLMDGVIESSLPSLLEKLRTRRYCEPRAESFRLSMVTAFSGKHVTDWDPCKPFRM